MDKDTIQEYQKIISNSVWSYIRKTGNDNLEAEELEQELWMQILEYNHKNGKLPDYKLAKTICNNTLVDLTRKGVRRNHLSYDFDEEGDRAEWEQDLSQNIESDAELNDFLSNFPEGSKERTFFDFYLAKSGAKDTGIVPELTRSEDGYTDSNLAKMLGFKGTGDRGWKRFRSEMKELARDYFGKK